MKLEAAATVEDIDLLGVLLVAANEVSVVPLRRLELLPVSSVAIGVIGADGVLLVADGVLLVVPDGVSPDLVVPLRRLELLPVSSVGVVGAGVVGGGAC